MPGHSFLLPESGFILLNLPLVVLHIVAIHIFWKCRKIAFCVKFWTLHLLLTCALVVTNRTLAYVLLNHEVGHYRLGYRVFDCLGRASIISSSLTTTVTGLDRLFSLIFAMRYRARMTSMKMYLLAATINSFSILASSTVFMGDITIIHHNEFFSSTELALWTSITLVAMSGLSTIAIYIAVGCIALKKKNAIHPRSNTENDYSRFLKFTYKAFAIVAIFTCCVVPGSTLVAADILYKDYIDVPYFTPVLYFTFFFLHPIVQISSFHETRYRILMMACCCCKSYKDKMKQDFQTRYATFHIFTIERNSNHVTVTEYDTDV